MSAPRESFAVGMEQLALNHSDIAWSLTGQGQKLAHFSFSCPGKFIQQLIDQGLQSDKKDKKTWTDRAD